MMIPIRPLPFSPKYSTPIYQLLQKDSGHGAPMMPAAFMDSTMAKLRASLLVSDGLNTDADFRTCATRVLGRSAYAKFVQTAGYSDFEDAHYRDAINNYGFDDVYRSDTHEGFFVVPWNLLLERLLSAVAAACSEFTIIKGRACTLDYNGPPAQGQLKNLFKKSKETLTVGALVTRRSPSRDPSDRDCDPPEQRMIALTCRHVILAVPPHELHKLRPIGLPALGTSLKLVTGCLAGQPFLRVYVKIAKHARAAVAQYADGYTVVTGPLQKIIAMDAAAGIYMLAYADNANASTLLRIMRPKSELLAQEPCVLRTHEMRVKEHFTRLLLQAVPEIDTALATVRAPRSAGAGASQNIIAAMCAIYWRCGTHYVRSAKRGSPAGTCLGPPTSSHEVDARFASPAVTRSSHVTLVGEAFSRSHQGWVEGALQSVDERLL